MGSFVHYNVDINITPPTVAGTRVATSLSPTALLNIGFNIPLEIVTATIFRQPPNQTPLSSIVVMAHFDTGASRTSIDINLAKHLNLQPIGQSLSYTAAGPQLMPDYAVDIGFPNTNLSPFKNLKIGSCQLITFNLQNSLSNQNDPNNFGILLGRDIMSRWNIVWNGPTSTVFISD
jgi:hypothetical protein